MFKRVFGLLRAELFADWPFRNVHDELPIPTELPEHRDKLSALFGNQTDAQVFSHLYDSLSILDAKSGSLLQFNSVLVAVFTIFLSMDMDRQLWIFGGTGLILTLLSCYILLSVVWVHWSTTPHMSHAPTHALTLLEFRHTRTVSYRLAWNFSRAGTLALAALIVHVMYVEATRGITG